MDESVWSAIVAPHRRNCSVQEVKDDLLPRSPSVSIIVPTMNEEGDIGAALSSIADNHYPGHLLEVIVVDGGSTDRTLEVVHSYRTQLPLEVIVEPGCTVYRALNIALAKTVGEVVLRVDARSVIPPNYIRTCVDHLTSKNIECVGGVQEQYGTSLVGNAIAIATSHPLGVGGAAFRMGRRSGFVDTVYLGCYPRRVFAQVGEYDADGPVVSEDAMLNKRIRDQGGRIYLDHTLRVRYPAKSSLGALTRQYFIYGGAKAHVWIKYRTLTSWRQIAPLAFLVWMVLTATLSFFSSIATTALILTSLTYLGLIAGASLLAAKSRRQIALAGPLILAFLAIHFAWPFGFLLRVAFPPLYFRLLSRPKAAR